MRRVIAATFTAAGFLLAAGAAQAQPVQRPGTPQGPQARLACNNVKDPGQRGACIARVCASVPAPLKKACIDGTGPFASKPPVKPPVKPVVGKPPLKPPVPNPAAARRACNNIKDPRQRGACIAKACAPVPPAVKQACLSGTGSFAGRPPVKPPVKPVVGKPPLKPPVGKPNAALLNQKRSQLTSLRNEVLRLCQQVYDGKAEADCIAGAFPPIPRALPLKKPAN